MSNNKINTNRVNWALLSPKIQTQVKSAITKCAKDEEFTTFATIIRERVTSLRMIATDEYVPLGWKTIKCFTERVSSSGPNKVKVNLYNHVKLVAFSGSTKYSRQP